ncbi:MAG: cytochrome c [Oligoflexia bacterium]|nr:cytochrome c [Oligoflexia bacterium]
MRIFALVCALGMMASSVSFAFDCKGHKADLARAKTSFTTNCVSCHGEKGDGNGPAGQYMNPKPRSFATDDFKSGGKKPNADLVFTTISKGLAGTAMTAFEGQIKDEKERCDLAHYVLSFRKK